MKKNLTELVMILDKSGSMHGLEADTIGGFNAMIDKQKKENENGDVLVSVVLFNEKSDVIYDRKDIKAVEPMNDRQYSVSGCTALLDAVGRSIRHIKRVHKYSNPDTVPEKTLFIITTDGMENASREYTYRDVKKMIEKQKDKHHWEFIFMGANIDAIETAERFGIRKERAVTYRNDSAGQALNYKVMSEIVHRVRSSASHADMAASLDEDEVMAPIREYYRRK
ncbi:MAG: VWA domain-containing protein [Solobacterium sp.]|nr:VWA domain-containing protein [Solobacterium sp.]